MTVVSAFARAPALEERTCPSATRSTTARSPASSAPRSCVRPGGSGGSPFSSVRREHWRRSYGVYTLFTRGVGIWGINTSVVWGYAIANYVWWIGIGNAGTLISSLLLLTRQSWRASISRFAEAMTLFAVAIAGPVPDLPSRAPALFLLARALSGHDAGLAAMAQRAHLGLLGDHQLSHLFDHLLVCRRPARSRDAARPLTRRLAKDLRGLRARLARLGTALAPLSQASDHACGSGDSAGLLGPFDRRARLRREPDAGLARADLSALFCRRRDVFGLRRRRHAGSFNFSQHGPSARSSPRAISRRWRRSC